MKKRKTRGATPKGLIAWTDRGNDRWLGSVTDEPELTFEAYLWWDGVTALPHGVETNCATVTLTKKGEVLGQVIVRTPPYDKNDNVIGVSYLQHAAEMLLFYELAARVSLHEEEE